MLTTIIMIIVIAACAGSAQGSWQSWTHPAPESSYVTSGIVVAQPLFGLSSCVLCSWARGSRGIMFQGLLFMIGSLLLFVEFGVNECLCVFVWLMFCVLSWLLMLLFVCVMLLCLDCCCIVCLVIARDLRALVPDDRAWPGGWIDRSTKYITHMSLTNMYICIYIYIYIYIYAHTYTYVYMIDDM